MLPASWWCLQVLKITFKVPQCNVTPAAITPWCLLKVRAVCQVETLRSHGHNECQLRSDCKEKRVHPTFGSPRIQLITRNAA